MTYVCIWLVSLSHPTLSQVPLMPSIISTIWYLCLNLHWTSGSIKYQMFHSKLQVFMSFLQCLYITFLRWILLQCFVSRFFIPRSSQCMFCFYILVLRTSCSSWERVISQFPSKRTWWEWGRGNRFLSLLMLLRLKFMNKDFNST